MKNAFEIASESFAAKFDSPIEQTLYYALAKFGVRAETQYVAHGIRCDLVFPQKKLVIECDGEEFHKDKLKDQARDKILTDRGWTVLRFTGSEIFKNNGSDVAFKITTQYFDELLETTSYLAEIERLTIRTPEPQDEQNM